MMPSTTKVLFELCLAFVATLLAAGQVMGELVPLPPKPLVNAADDLYGDYFVIAPDESKIFFLGQDEFNQVSPPPYRIFEVPIFGGPVTTRTNPANGFEGSVRDWTFAPNGKDLVFSDGRSFFSGDAFVMPIALGAPRQLTFGYNVSTMSYWRPTFSQDGSRIIFLGGIQNTPQELFSVPLDGSSPPLRLNNPLPWIFGEVGGDWKLVPDSNDVLYVAPQADDSANNLYRVDASGGIPMKVNLTEGLEAANSAANSFLIDGSDDRVVYSVHQGPTGGSTIMSRLLSGGPEIELTPGMAKQNDAHISLLGFAQDLVIFEADFNYDYGWELYAASATGGPVQLLKSAFTYRPESAAISPDGSEVTFTGFDESKEDTFLFDVATRSVKGLDLPPGSRSPTTQFNSTGDYFLLYGSGNPMLFSASGAFIRSVPVNSAFMPDGDHIYYIAISPGPRGDQNELFMERLDGAGGAIHLSKDGSGDTSVRGITFTGDGSTLFYSRDDYGQPFQLYAVQFVPEPGAAAIALTGILLLWRRRGCASRV
jgi:hypothetical protein